MKHIALILVVLTNSLWGQSQLLDVRVEVSKKEFVPYERIDATVYIKNNSAQPLRLHNEKGRNWLEFVINRNGTRDVKMAKNALFADAVIPPSQIVKRTYTISSLYPLSAQGNYTMRARVNAPASSGIAMSRSKPVFFDVVGAVSIFTKQVGVAAEGGKVFAYHIKALNKIGGNELYFQSYEGNSSVPFTTRTLGGYTNINRPSMMIDRKGYLNVLFQINAKIFRFLTINPEGRILKQELHKLTASGTPFLYELRDSKEVVVRNSLVFDADKVAEAKRAIHNISQRPPFSY